MQIPVFVLLSEWVLIIVQMFLSYSILHYIFHHHLSFSTLFSYNLAVKVT